MKKFILAIVAIAMSSVAKAEDYKYLTVATSSQESSIELATIQKIMFDMTKETVIVITSEGEVSFPQKEMQKMFFSEAATAIETMAAESDNLQLAGGVLNAKGNGLLRIYNAAGALQRMANVEGSAKISLGNLPAGVYIINLGNQTIKVKK